METATTSGGSAAALQGLPTTGNSTMVGFPVLQKGCSTLPMNPRPLRTWLSQVGAVRGVGALYENA
jgi:hypothetical protein